ncbi:MAG: hypothetical protein NT099_04735 [Candidatus Saganbacteria bacterium]|nr:hypothetical protein [Candidatus Saganbacteria bacterium]
MFQSFLNTEPNEIKEWVILSPIISPSDIKSSLVTDETASKSSLGYLVLNGKGATFIKCPRGSNWAAEIVPLLKETACKKVLFLGAIGGLADNVKIGDLIAGASAQNVCSISEWLMCSIKSENKEVPASLSLLKKTSLTKGKVASVPLLFSETKSLVEKLKESGCMGIEMESAPLYLACERHGIEVLGLYLVTDLPLTHTFYSDACLINDKTVLKEKLKLLIKNTLNIIGA